MNISYMHKQMGKLNLLGGSADAAARSEATPKYLAWIFNATTIITLLIPLLTKSPATQEKGSHEAPLVSGDNGPINYVGFIMYCRFP